MCMKKDGRTDVGERGDGKEVPRGQGREELEGAGGVQGDGRHHLPALGVGVEAVVHHAVVRWRLGCGSG